MVQNEKRFCLLKSISQEPYIMWLSFVVDKCKIIPPGFFSFFQNFDFLVSGIKGQKMAQNDKNFCLLHLISQESLLCTYIKGNISLFFSIFNFWGQYWGKRGKNDPKWQKIVCYTHISGSIHHMIKIFGTHI